MQGSDRLLLITQGSISATPVAAVSGPSREGLSPDLAVHHLRLPQQYISSSWPLVHAALSSDGMDVAVAGTQGLALYSRRSARWRLFGDISQERSVAVQVGHACEQKGTLASQASMNTLLPDVHDKTKILLQHYRPLESTDRC